MLLLSLALALFAAVVPPELELGKSLCPLSFPFLSVQCSGGGGGNGEETADGDAVLRKKEKRGLLTVINPFPHLHQSRVTGSEPCYHHHQLQQLLFLLFFSFSFFFLLLFSSSFPVVVPVLSA